MSLTPAMALERLQQAYREPLAAARQAKGRGLAVVGYVDPATPIEYVLAADAFPVLIAALWPHQTPCADALIDRSEPWNMRSIAERALNGDLAFLDLLIIGRREEWLYYNLKEAVRTGAGSRVPPLLLCDLIQNDQPSIERYNVAQVGYLREALQRELQRPFEPKKLRDAVSVTNERLGIQQALLKLRDAGQLSGTRSMECLGSAYYLQPAEYSRLLELAMQGEDFSDVSGVRPRVLVVSGEALYHTRLHHVLETRGVLVVAEDVWFGTRSVKQPVELDGDLESALLRSYVREVQGEEVQPPALREAWLRLRLGRGDLHGVMIYLPPGDKRFGWSVPGLLECIKACGQASGVLRTELTAESLEGAPELAPFMGSLEACL